MKRLGSSESFGAFMPMCPTTGNNHVYNMEFQSMMELGLEEEEDCCMEEYSLGQKKRRLSVKQVKELEKTFEVDNKLEPERKVKLAQEIGLQPRQVAVWFQNRRARWKTKQLERDYGLLNANYEAVKHKYDKLQHDNEALLNEIRELKSKLQVESEESNLCIKEDGNATESACKLIDQIKPSSFSSVFPDLKDGSCDSDSSAILNEDYSPNPINSSSWVLHETTYPFNGSSSSSQSQSQFVKIEEHNFFGGDDENCNFFSEEQSPTLQWYCPDQWN